MKINRLLSITTILLNKKTVKAADLAERFGVSTRTIYRDIDVLSASGVPVICSQGTNGGISILEDYTVSRATLSPDERSSVLSALQTLQATQFPDIDTVLEKLGGLFPGDATDWISVDFSPWGSNPNAYHKFSDLRTAILRCRIIEISYINAFNESSIRAIEPLRLIFKSQAWYLWGFCLKKQDYRMFRISRIRELHVTETKFDRTKLHPLKEQEKPQTERRPDVHLILRFTADALYRLCDDYDDNVLTDNGGGSYTLDVVFPEDSWVYGYILSFGDSVEVIEPEWMREKIREQAVRIAKKYMEVSGKEE